MAQRQNNTGRIHFIGVGGVGMSGIARVAADQGFCVSGSDMKASRYTKQLEAAGVTVHIGQRAENLEGMTPNNTTVVVSTAILDNNAELTAARAAGLPIIHRAQMLARLGEGLQTLAVAGTHGKTTTSSMLASVLDTMGLDPTFLIGGMVRQYGTNAHSGTGAYYVVEADESDKSFTYLSPAAVIVTNIEPDHLDHYANLDEIYDKFSQFIASVPAGAPVCVCAQDTRAVEIARAATQNVITYGLTPELQNGEGLTGDEDATSDTFGITPDAQITAVATHGVGSTFTLRLPSGRVVESAIKQNPGAHNVLNGAAVLTLLDALGQDVQAAAGALAQFAGVHRRFDLVGEAHDVTVVDDYGHHPTEIAATVRAALALDFKRVHVLFQPHRYSRVGLFTEVLHDQFAAAFDGAANVVFMDVYSAGETPVPGVTGQTFMNVLDSNAAAPARKFVPRRLDVPGSVCDLVRPGDLVITMGAGDVTEMGALILDEINRRAAAGTFAKERA